jgi:hypothetical protein
MLRAHVVQQGSLWIAHLVTRYGHAEILCGEGNEPDLKELLLVERFLDDSVDHISSVRRSAFKMPRLWRPIRFAVNNQGRLGLQFQHRLTGKQDGMFFADEHSTFRTSLSDITIEPGDAERFVQRGPDDEG